MGSVFSPYYKASCTRDPEDHCAINVALYGRPARWAMTERGRHDILRTPDLLRVGPSEMRWDTDGLSVELNERCAPFPQPVRGVVRLRPRATTEFTYALDGAARHVWRPIAPLADVEVRLDAPDLNWNGAGYFDTNWGSEPLSSGFRAWTWARTAFADRAEIQFDVERRDGSRAALALSVDNEGECLASALGPRRMMPPGFWGVSRPVCAETPARLSQVWEDTPFYTRSRISLDGGQNAATVYESLDLDRFDARWVQTLLGFRMPRRISPRAPGCLRTP